MKKAGAILFNRLSTQDFIASLVLAVLFWIARYWMVGQFGLYEDDLTIIPAAAGMSFGEVLQFIWVYITHLYGHARPLSDSFIYLFSNLGWRLGGLPGIYLLGYALTLINILLFYFLVRRSSNPVLAFLAGMAYCLYSADTTQAFLTHSLGVQPSITLLLIAAHQYLSNRKWLAYPLAFLILFSYETPFLVFLGVPLLKRKWDRNLVKEFVLHGLLLVAMLAAVFLLRSLVGEGRVLNLSREEMLSVPIQQVLRGTRVSLTKYFRVAEQAARHLLAAKSSLVPVLSAFGAFLIILWAKVQRPFPVETAAAFEKISLKPRKFFIPAEFRELGQLLLCALVMIAAAYPLTFTTVADAVTGRESRVHLAAVVGNALLMGVLLYAGFAVAKRLRITLAASALTAVWFSLLVGYGFEIQQDYKLSWALQQDFWREVIQLAPDAGENAVILVDPSGLEDTVQIDANTWNLPRILPQLYEMPVEWKNPPRVYRLRDHWEDNLAASPTEFNLYVETVTAPPSLYGVVMASDVIFLDTRSGKMERRVEPLPINGQYYEIKPVSTPILPGLARALLYELMIR